MLVLTRKTGERLVLTIGNHLVTVDILSITRGRTRIGIEAPPEIKVLREEIVGTSPARRKRRQCAESRRDWIRIVRDH